jgi:integrating conjugative element protein (TIGR03755 family)
MKQAQKLAGLIVLALSQATHVVALDDEFYYNLGGGEPISRSATNRAATFELGPDISWSTDLICGDFDMSLSVENQLMGIEGAFSDLMGSVISAATGAVASLPGLALQKLNPALYDMLQNGILQGSEEFHLAETSCEAMVGKMGEVMDTNEWGTVAQGPWWSTESQTAGADILNTKGRADSEGADAGVVWVEGASRGGRAQPPIELVGDTAKAGYNQLINRNPGNTGSAVTTCAGAAICEEWEAPQFFADWIIEVLGEEKIRTCKNCDKVRTQPGKGLSAQVKKEWEAISLDIETLVLSSSAPTSDELKEVSGGPGMLVSRRVIEAIREEKEEDQAVLISRLASEMALARTMERAMIARRALLAGMKEPNIASTGIAPERLERYLGELEQEVDNLLFEMDVRKRVATNTTSQLLRRDKARKEIPVAEEPFENNFSDGAVKP